jgi:hypothetical protein
MIVADHNQRSIVARGVDLSRGWGYAATPQHSLGRTDMRTEDSFLLTFKDAVVARKWGANLFVPASRAAKTAVTYEELKELAALTTAGPFAQLIMLDEAEWACARISTDRTRPHEARVEDLETYERLKNRRIAAKAAEMQTEVIAEYRLRGITIPIKRRWRFLSSLLDMRGRSLFMCHADDHVQDHIIALVKKYAQQVAVGQLSLWHAQDRIGKYIDVVYARYAEAS